MARCVVDGVHSSKTTYNEIALINRPQVWKRLLVYEAVLPLVHLLIPGFLHEDVHNFGGGTANVSV